MRRLTVNQSKQLGLTFVELIAVIIISGIMATGVVTFILGSVQGINSAGSRNQLATSGRIILDRMAMEIHNALPNSIRTRTFMGRECIEMIPVRGATTYIDPPFTGGGTDTFDVVDFKPDQQGMTGGYAVIYPNRQDEIYDGDNGASSNWPDFPDRGPIEAIIDIDDSGADDQSTVTLVTDHRFNRRSPNQRFFVVEDPVSYCVDGDKLYRYTNYGFYTMQTTEEEESGVCEVAMDDTCLPNYVAAPDKMLIANNIDNSGTAFDVATQSLTRNSLVSIDITITANGESVTLSHEILTRNVP